MKSFLYTLTMTVSACLCAFSTAYAQSEPAFGDRWSEPARLASQDLLLAIDGVSGGLVLAGARGHILFSGDQGATWVQSKVPTRATLTGVDFVTLDIGWAVGHDSIILHTADGGRTWAIQNHDPAAETPFLDVWFADEQHGFAIGAYGLMLETNDAGATWEQVVFEPVTAAGPTDEAEGEDAWWESEMGGDYHLNDIMETRDRHLFIAAEAGNIYRSDDLGASWVTVSPDYQGSFFGIFEAGLGRIITVGLRGNLYYTDDLGANWVPVELPTQATLNSGILLIDGTILVAGLGGTILVSRDNGDSFELHTQENRKGVQAAMQLEDGRVMLVGEAGVAILKLGFDGGRNSD
ncbi:MAG: YCF48-related protein [Gammaproteobacteria bacterium]|nr:YCF48-related protein [Gammaproteobacteria bacterium]